jgi:hypothetical protein
MDQNDTLSAILSSCVTVSYYPQNRVICINHDRQTFRTLSTCIKLASDAQILEWRGFVWKRKKRRVRIVRVSMNGSGQIWFESYYYIIFLFDPIKFRSKNLNPYPIWSDHKSSRPDPYKIIKYFLYNFKQLNIN